MARDVLASVGMAVFLFGLFTFFTAVLGVFRFHYVLNRMHAAAVGDALGIFCILIGLIFLHGWSMSAIKLILVFLFLWLSSPVSTHLLAEMEVETVPNIRAACKEEER
jgi:multicomponent Na+:H+ antiporter subunit G